METSLSSSTSSLTRVQGRRCLHHGVVFVVGASMKRKLCFRPRPVAAVAAAVAAVLMTATVTVAWTSTTTTTRVAQHRRGPLPSSAVIPAGQTTPRLHSLTDDEAASAGETTTTTAPSSDSVSRTSSDLPDYGTTPVEIDKIPWKDDKDAAAAAAAVSSRWRREDLFGSSIIDQTVAGMETDEEFQAVQRKYAQPGGAKAVTAQERAARRRALTDLGVPSFAKFVFEETADKTALRRKEPTILQINIGLYCNQACGHCHVESSPLRTAEQMTAETAAECLRLLAATPSVTTLDITGGAPELNSSFRYLVAAARALRGPDDLIIIDRCNLTVLQEPGQEDLIDFLKRHSVRIVASLPCYSAENVDRQRGRGVFERSIAALLALNDAGYGTDPDLKLDLVYNPAGAFLPPEQSKLRDQYKRELAANFGILFNELFTFTNMPIKRFADYLHRRGELKEYMDLLVRNFNADTVPELMCLNTVSVGWDGAVYDCDFNQQLAMTIHNKKKGNALTVRDLESLTDLQSHRIRTDNHCFGCTAGMGSS